MTLSELLLSEKPKLPKPIHPNAKTEPSSVSTKVFLFLAHTCKYQWPSIALSKTRIIIVLNVVYFKGIGKETGEKGCSISQKRIKEKKEDDIPWIESKGKRNVAGVR